MPLNISLDSQMEQVIVRPEDKDCDSDADTASSTQNSDGESTAQPFYYNFPSNVESGELAPYPKERIVKRSDIQQAFTFAKTFVLVDDSADHQWTHATVMVGQILMTKTDKMTEDES